MASRPSLLRRLGLSLALSAGAAFGCDAGDSTDAKAADAPTAGAEQSQAPEVEVEMEAIGKPGAEQPEPGNGEPSRPAPYVAFPEVQKLLHEERFEEALQLVAKLEKTNREDPDLMLARGTALIRLGRSSEALVGLTRARKLSPDLRMASVELAAAYHNTGNPDRAKAALQGVEVKFRRPGDRPRQVARFKEVCKLTGFVPEHEDPNRMGRPILPN